MTRRVRVLTSNDAPEQTLLAAVRVLHAEGAVAAFQSLTPGGTNYLRHLGPGFFTKVLYFAGWDKTPDRLQPLVLDQYVALALNDLLDWGWQIDWAWTAEQYERYLRLADDWARTLGTSPDVVERLLFQHGKSL